MSYATNKFLKVYGRAKPKAKDGLHLPPAWAMWWSRLKKEISPGWYKDRFLYLFGEGLDDYKRCLDAWSFLLPNDVERIILGRNAYGSLLILEDPTNEMGGQIGVLETLTVQYTTRSDWLLSGLLVGLLVNGELDIFVDDSVYSEWRQGAKKTKSPFLPDDVILGIQTPLPLDGTMTLSNFRARPIVEYYEATADVYRDAYRSAKKTGKR
jgi:hypothetical protein